MENNINNSFYLKFSYQQEEEPQFYKIFYNMYKDNYLKNCSNTLLSQSIFSEIDENIDEKDGINDENIDEEDTNDEESDNDNNSNFITDKNRFFNDKKTNKFKIKKTFKDSIFQTFNGLQFNNGFNYRITDKEHLYAYDFNDFLSKNIKNTKYNSSNQVFINYSGGYVPEVKKSIFKKMKCEYNDEDLMVQIVDFSGMYQSIMIIDNICSSTMFVNGLYPALMDGKLYNPNDDFIFNTYIVDIKIQSTILPFIVFITKYEVKKSLTTLNLENYKKQRKIYKNEMEKYKSNKTSIDYLKANKTQLYYKLMSNAGYGKLKSIYSSVFNPLCSSLITQRGRQLLFRLFMFIHYYIYKKGINPLTRRVLYGDTDSLFCVMTKSEINDIVKYFNVLQINNNIVGIELEKSIDNLICLAKKNYISYYNNSVYMKGVLKKSQSTLSRTFLNNFFNFVFKIYLSHNNNDDEFLKNEIIKMLNEYYSASDDMFVFKQKLSKDLNFYSNKTTKLFQLDYIANKNKITFPSGTIVQYAFFNFIFNFDCKRKSERLNKKIKDCRDEINSLIEGEKGDNLRILDIEKHIKNLKKEKNNTITNIKLDINNLEFNGVETFRKILIDDRKFEEFIIKNLNRYTQLPELIISKINLYRKITTEIIQLTNEKNKILKSKELNLLTLKKLNKEQNDSIRELSKNESEMELFCNKFIQYDNIVHVKFVSRNPNSNLLLLDLLSDQEYMEKIIKNNDGKFPELDKAKNFEMDLLSIFKKFFESVGDDKLKKIFYESFEIIFKRKFDFIKNVSSDNKKHTKKLKSDNNMFMADNDNVLKKMKQVNIKQMFKNK